MPLNYSTILSTYLIHANVLVSKILEVDNSTFPVITQYEVSLHLKLRATRGCVIPDRVSTLYVSTVLFFCNFSYGINMSINSRPTWEGGRYDGDESTRQAALRRAMELGADYIDIELKVAFSEPIICKCYLYFYMILKGMPSYKLVAFLLFSQNLCHRL